MRIWLVLILAVVVISIPLFADKPLPGDTFSQEMGDLSSTMGHNKQNQAYIIFKRRGARLIQRWGASFNEWFHKHKEHASAKPRVIEVPNIPVQ